MIRPEMWFKEPLMASLHSGSGAWEAHEIDSAHATLPPSRPSTLFCHPQPPHLCPAALAPALPPSPAPCQRIEDINIMTPPSLMKLR